jgi:hypothetical protein
MTRETTAELIDRLADVDRRVQSIANSDRLSATGQMNALALLVSLHGDIFGKAAAELRRLSA